MAPAPQPNTPAVDFTLPDADAKPVKLSDYRGRNVVLAFYPADWSPVCTSELALIQETIDEIHGYNAEVLGISVDNHWSHKAWADRQHLTFPLLSDFWPHGEVSQRYGVFLEKAGISNRALVFIDASGVIRGVWVAENPSIAPGINLIFETLGQMQGASPQEARRA